MDGVSFDIAVGETYGLLGPNGAGKTTTISMMFEFDSSAAGQVTSSVRAVLSHEANLKRYFIAMPLDMPAGDTEERTSAHTR